MAEPSDNLKREESQGAQPSEVVSGELLVKCQQEREEYLAGWQRAKADFINYKKDEAARLTEMLRYAQEDMLLEFITVLDSFDLGLAALEKAGSVEKGVYMIRAQIEDVLKKRGVEKIPIQAGEQYNPAMAEAIAEVDSDKPPGSIIAEIEPGYRLGDRIIRPARVKVAKLKN